MRSSRQTTWGTPSPIGKDRNHPSRFGSLLARKEAISLVRSGLCRECSVELTFSPVDHSVVTNVKVNTFGTVLAGKSDENLSTLVAATVMEFDKRIDVGNFYCLNNGGSSVNGNFEIQIKKEELKSE